MSYNASIHVALVGMLALVAGCGETSPSEEAGGAQLQTAAAPSGWRMDGTGSVPEATPVTVWSKDENVLWRAEVGGSYSSPVVVGSRVFVTSEPSQLVCVDVADGAVLWSKSNGIDDLPAEKRPQGEPRGMKKDCGDAAPTPASDGRNVFVSFNTGIVAAYDLAGNRKWIEYFDRECVTAHGRSASPVLAGGLLLAHISHLSALDPETGRIVWEAEGAEESYGTPAIATIGGKEVAITPNGDVIRVADGKIIAKEVARASYTSPVVNGNTVVFIDAYATAVRLPDAMSDSVEVKELWLAELSGEFYASPVCHDGLIYAASSLPSYYVLDAASGEIVLEKTPMELPPAGAVGDTSTFVYPSVLMAGDSIFICNNAGNTFVLEPGREYREKSRNDLPNGSGGSIASVGERLYVRGGDHLYCIGRN